MHRILLWYTCLRGVLYWWSKFMLLLLHSSTIQFIWPFCSNLNTFISCSCTSSHIIQGGPSCWGWAVPTQSILTFRTSVRGKRGPAWTNAFNCAGFNPKFFLDRDGKYPLNLHKSSFNLMPFLRCFFHVQHYEQYVNIVWIHPNGFKDATRIHPNGFNQTTWIHPDGFNE